MADPITIPAYGTKLKKGTTAIGNVLKVDGVGFEFGERETTNLDATEGTSRPTIPTGNEVTFEVNYHPDLHAALVTAALSRAVFSWSLCPPADDAADPVDMPPLPFAAWIKKFEFSGVEKDGTYVGTFTLKITGSVSGFAAEVTP